MLLEIADKLKNLSTTPRSTSGAVSQFQAEAALANARTWSISIGPSRDGTRFDGCGAVQRAYRCWRSGRSAQQHWTLEPASLLPGEAQADYDSVATRVVAVARPRDAIEEFFTEMLSI